MAPGLALRQLVLLPICGALAAVLSFVAAAPFIETLYSRNLPDSDPAAHFTVGTLWGNVNHSVFGALLCGSFSLVLVAQRKRLKVGLVHGFLGAVLGVVAGVAGDGGSDLIGIALERREQIPMMLPGLIWCLMVPTIFSFTIAVSVGPTLQRLKRAALASVAAVFASFVARNVAAMAVIPFLLYSQGGLTKDLLSSDPYAVNALRWKASMPGWLAEAVAIGIVLGLIISSAETMVRDGYLRLILGRNEGRTWGLDYFINRIGSSEWVEIPLGGISGVANVHAQVTRERGGFSLTDLSGGTTFVNGQPVQHCWLKSGDVVSLGSANIVFETRHRSGPVPSYPAIPPPGPLLVPEAFPTCNRSAVQEHRLTDPFGKIYYLSKGVHRVGRDCGNSVCVDWDMGVSRHHAEISITDSKAEVSDLGSRNGTHLNGNLLEQKALMRDGDCLQVGGVKLSYSVRTEGPNH